MRRSTSIKSFILCQAFLNCLIYQFLYCLIYHSISFFINCFNYFNYFINFFDLRTLICTSIFSHH